MLNNVAVSAAHLAERGERVVIVDYDAHHGNGTQDIFWNDPRGFDISLHEGPQYPGPGALSGMGVGGVWEGGRWVPGGRPGVSERDSQRHEAAALRLVVVRSNRESVAS